MTMLRYWKPWRKFIIMLSDHVPERIEEKLLDYLYPDDAVITFKESA
jgi:hypothetical protein